VKGGSEFKMAEKRKRKRKGWIIALIIISALGAGGVTGWSFLSREHNEARNLTLNAVDFSKLDDGKYVGEYEGGMYKWRAGHVQVIVNSGRVKEIKLLSSSDPGAGNTDYARLFDRVIEGQSLQVDTISGATLTSKAWLKAVENALIGAQK